jgi:hypothetical protein
MSSPKAHVPSNPPIEGYVTAPVTIDRFDDTHFVFSQRELFVLSPSHSPPII